MNSRATFLTLGFTHAWSGAALLWQEKALRKWALIPFLIDILLILGGVVWGLSFVSAGVASALAFLGLSGGGFFSQIFYYLFSIFLWVGYLIVIVYGTFLVATIVAAPFHALLAERTLIRLGVIEDRPFRFGTWIRTSVKMLGVSLVKASLFAFLGIFILIGSFVPGLNVISSFLAMLIMSFDSMDYSFEACGYGLRQRFSYFRQNFPQFLGMATGLGLTVFIPGLTLMMLPCSVVGSARLMQRTQQRI
jgi:uncharacterized protein involved in cysteine biosynthesis